ncbi:MAG: hypothetical protein HOP31_05615 [Ignavibacteria bacterium]|nr:hypothetical protein [Ignavibacteria bacterium]
MDKVQNTNNPRSYLKKFTSYFAFGSLYILLIIFFTSCQDNQGDVITSSAGENNFSAGFYSSPGGDNSLQLTEAKFVLRKLVLETENSENECDVKLGPFIIQLDMTAKVVNAGIAKMPFGSYDEVKFQVHKPTPNDGITDPDFIESNSRRYSVVVRGYYNSVPFTYKSDLTVVKEIAFEGAPVSIGAVPLVYITIRLEPYSWFWENGVFIDPSIEGNKHIIDQNIKLSLRRAFRDMDQNGEPD